MRGIHTLNPNRRVWQLQGFLQANSNGVFMLSCLPSHIFCDLQQLLFLEALRGVDADCAGSPFGKDFGYKASFPVKWRNDHSWYVTPGTVELGKETLHNLRAFIKGQPRPEEVLLIQQPALSYKKHSKPKPLIVFCKPKHVTITVVMGDNDLSLDSLLHRPYLITIFCSLFKTHFP